MSSCRVVHHALLLFLLGANCFQLLHAQQTGPEVARHELLPRKVIIGTTMTPWYSNYPGLDQRLQQMERLVDEMVQDSKQKYGRSLDLALFSEYAVTAGKRGNAAEVAVDVDSQILKVLGEKARQHATYIVFGGIFKDEAGAYTNSAVVIDRKGQLVGTYDKVHPVLDPAVEGRPATFEGGIRPGRGYPTMDLDFGRVGLQICYDVEYPDGWKALGEKGADLVLFLTQSPQLTRPAMYAATHKYWVVSSTFRNNASFFEPGTGLVAAQIKDPAQTLVSEIDLSYLLLPWSTGLRNGQAFSEAFGDRVGFRYSESEDRGLFWSNDSQLSIGAMARKIGLYETPAEQQARAKQAQDAARGGQPK